MCRLVSDQWTAYVALPTAVSVVETDVHRLSYATTPTPCVSSCCCCCCVPRLNNVGVTRYVQFTLTNAFPTLRGWCVTVLFLFCFSLIFICFICIFFVTLPHRQPRAIFGGFVRLSGERMLLREELIVAEDSPHITMQRIKAFC